MESDVFETLEFVTCVLNFSHSALWQNWMNGLVICEHWIEIGYIKWILGQLWFELRYDCLVDKGLLAYTCVPWMIKDFIDTSVRSKSIFWILHKALADEIFALFWHGDSMLLGIWEEYWLSLDQIVHFLVIWASGVKWWETDDHFVCQDTKSPPIDRESMTFLFENFWGQVFRSSTERVSLLILLKNFGESEISEANVAVFSHQNVFRF